MTPWTVACQASLSTGILQARILEWVAIASPEDLPNSEIKPYKITVSGIQLEINKHSKKQKNTINKNYQPIETD